MNIIKTTGELNRFALMIEAAIMKDGPVQVDWSLWSPSRSGAQNSYLFGVCYPLLRDAMGYDVDDIHTFMCGRHWGWVDKKCPKTPRNPEGIESVPVRTTTRNEFGKRSVINKKQFADFVAMVQRIAAGVGIFIPDPEPMQ